MLLIQTKRQQLLRYWFSVTFLFHQNPIFTFVSLAIRLNFNLKYHEQMFIEIDGDPLLKKLKSNEI